jgi:hypothetical protein
MKDPDRAKWLAAYRSSPLPLQRDLNLLLGQIKNEDIGVHNKISREISYLCPSPDKLVKAVADAILNAASETE